MVVSVLYFILVVYGFNSLFPLRVLSKVGVYFYTPTLLLVRIMSFLLCTLYLYLLDFITIQNHPSNQSVGCNPLIYNANS